MSGPRDSVATRFLGARPIGSYVTNGFSINLMKVLDAVDARA
jgi:hypothetical protein